MKTILAVISLSLLSGCQTTKHIYPIDPQTQKVTVSVTPSDGKGRQLEKIDSDSVLTFEFKVMKTDGVRKIPHVDIKQNQWATIDVDIDIIGLEQTAALQIEDEIIEIKCSPGFHVKVKAIPLGENKVHLKGAYVYSDIKEKNLTKPKEIMPFSVIAGTGKTIVLYELKTKFEPGN